MKSLTLDVPTVHCRACKLNIEEALDELHGVASGDVDVGARTVDVCYDPDAVHPDAITRSIEEAGYTVRPAGSM